MPTTYQDQFFILDPANPPLGQFVTFAIYDFTDQDDDGNIETGTGDTWDGRTISRVWQDDTITVNVPGVGNVTYTGVTFYFADGSPPVFTPTDGQVLQNGTLVSATFVTTPTQTPVGDFGPTCFVPGTMIETIDGPRAIETLRPGDLIKTMDAGAQPVRHILDGRFRASAEVAPVTFAPGSIGNDAPLTVSPQHRVLIRGWRAELFYGEAEVLVAAKHLVNGVDITQRVGGVVRYIHLMFDAHQIIWGQGVPSESYYPGHSAVDAEMARLFPHAPAAAQKSFVRPVIGAREARVIAA